MAGLVRTAAAARRPLAGAARAQWTVRQQPQQRRALSMAIKQASAVDADGVVRVSFADGHESSFHPVWLKDHNPDTLHPTSLQRQLDSATLDPETPLPDEVSVVDNGARVQVAWAADGERITFDADFLRRHCYDASALAERHERLAKMRTPWASKDLPKEAVTRVTGADLASSDDALRKVLQALVKDGVTIVTDMPSSIDETEAIVRRIGPPRETFYGGMWDTAPKAEGEVNDTAYTKDALHGHTDTSYLLDSPGLQIFNCVAQSDPTTEDGLNHEGEIEGATKLVDGFKVLDVLKNEYPETFEFFATTPLKWHCIEDGVFVKAWARVIEFEPGSTTAIKQFRYNSYDLSPVDYLAPEKVLDYYRHTKIINDLLRDPKYISYMRMNVGEMVIIDNHRVCHGRTAFSGFRNMVGCYIGRDDWLSKLRTLLPAEDNTLINDE
ncbi:Trimethyllysine dioxygenase [Hondaea fermentalgiana]|uniref:Trimethyllysine dioxygenase n=1 Tax=Hondaea fermentalgiana TaxID=2315210 RepID=A0A2R5G2U4_9STRA|nr:Trimethyllysine dioxygenase [Hondaea fermentalgiana]|eukprot:GBG25322.1 Trimethyllysine dioxygenase [Hondaea fermentalgiana]